MLNMIAQHCVCVKLNGDLNLLLILLEDDHKGKVEAFICQEGWCMGFPTTAELDQDLRDTKYQITHMELVHESLNGGPE